MRPADVLSQMLNRERPNYISPGLVSHLVGDEGNKFGRVRMFHNTREQEFFITPHTHRFDFTCVVLEGSVINRTYALAPRHVGDRYLRSYYFVKDGTTSGCELENYIMTDIHYPQGSWYTMEYKEFHSIQFSKNAKVIFFEGKPRSDTSFILQPWVNGKVIPTFSVEEWMYK